MVHITPITYIVILFVLFYLARLSLSQILYPSKILLPDKVSKRSNITKRIANVLTLKIILSFPNAG